MFNTVKLKYYSPAGNEAFLASGYKKLEIGSTEKHNFIPLFSIPSAFQSQGVFNGAPSGSSFSIPGKFSTDTFAVESLKIIQKVFRASTPKYIQESIGNELKNSYLNSKLDFKQQVIHVAEKNLTSYISGFQFDETGKSLGKKELQYMIPTIDNLSVSGNTYGQLFNLFRENKWARITLTTGTSFVTNIGFIGVITDTGIQPLVCTVIPKANLELVKFYVLQEKAIPKELIKVYILDVMEVFSGLFFKQYIKILAPLFDAHGFEVIAKADFNDIFYKRLVPDQSSRTKMKQFYETLSSEFLAVEGEKLGLEKAK